MGSQARVKGLCRPVRLIFGPFLDALALPVEASNPIRSLFPLQEREKRKQDRHPADVASTAEAVHGLSEPDVFRSINAMMSCASRCWDRRDLGITTTAKDFAIRYMPRL